MAVDVQLACADDGLPPPGAVRRWARVALAEHQASAELTVRIVDEAEGAVLNRRFRGADGPTNVLSFPFDPPPGHDLALLGDVVICAPVVRREACEQGKSVDAHMAHMVIHGVLHLLGHDHQGPEEAERMERLERDLLGEFGFANPYRTGDPE